MSDRLSTTGLQTIEDRLQMAPTAANKARLDAGEALVIVRALIETRDAVNTLVMQQSVYRGDQNFATFQLGRALEAIGIEAVPGEDIQDVREGNGARLMEGHRRGELGNDGRYDPPDRTILERLDDIDAEATAPSPDGPLSDEARQTVLRLADELVAHGGNSFTGRIARELRQAVS